MGVWITIAPGNYTGDVQADFVCRGHDECVLQATIDKAVADDKNVFLLNGVYHMDAFRDVYGDGGPLTTLCVPNTWREIKIVGENSEYGFQKDYRNGVVLYVPKEALESVPGEKDVLRGRWTDAGIQTRNRAHKTVCTTEERLRYCPQYGEQIFDLTLGKMVLCIDPEKRKWVDFNGGEV